MEEEKKEEKKGAWAYWALRVLVNRAPQAEQRASVLLKWKNKVAYFH